MRILFVADVSIQSVIGGAERMLFEQSVRLARRGHEVHILTRRPPGDERARIDMRQVTEHRYGVDARSSLSQLCSSLRNARRLFNSLLDVAAFDCLHFHQPFSAAGVLCSRRARSIPKLYSNYSLSFEEFVSRNRPPAGLLPRAVYGLNRIARKRLEKWVLERCRTIIVLSHFSQQRLGDAHGIPPHRTTVIPGGVDTEKFSPARDKLAVRRRLQLPTDRVILFTVRNLVARMGLENVLLAVKAAIRQAPDLYLVLAGDGPLNADLRALAKRERIEDHVRFTGFIPEGQLPSYYQMADLFVLPTRELEGFGLVTLESLACGVPVAGTPVGGTLEILGKFDPAFLFRDTSPAAMAETIMGCHRQMLECPQQWVDLGTRCRRFIEDHYSWTACIDALENLYQELAPSSGAQRKRPSHPCAGSAAR